MKKLLCSDLLKDVYGGCQEEFVGSDTEDVVEKAIEHARNHHMDSYHKVVEIALLKRMEQKFRIHDAKKV